MCKRSPYGKSWVNCNMPLKMQCVYLQPSSRHREIVWGLLLTLATSATAASDGWIFAVMGHDITLISFSCLIHCSGHDTDKFLQCWLTDSSFLSCCYTASTMSPKLDKYSTQTEDNDVDCPYKRRSGCSRVVLRVLKVEPRPLSGFIITSSSHYFELHYNVSLHNWSCYNCWSFFHIINAILTVGISCT